MILNSKINTMTRSKLPFKKKHDHLGKQVMSGVFATVLVVAGEKLIFKLAKHPLLVFGAGMIGGVAVYKNREAIIASANKTVEIGRNVALEQKEKVLDLIAEAKEGG